MTRRILRPRRQRLLWGSAVLALAVLAVAQAGPVLVTPRELAAPDAVLPLASHEWERLPEAAAHARGPSAPLVLLTVPRVADPYNCHRCADRVDWLVKLGVSPGQIRLLPRRVENTRDEAQAALKFSRASGIQRLLIVTSPYHSRRSLATFDDVFERSGIEVGVQPSSYSVAVPRRWWSAPYDRWYVRYEWTALAFYFARYGITPWV